MNQIGWVVVSRGVDENISLRKCENIWRQVLLKPSKVYGRVVNVEEAVAAITHFHAETTKLLAGVGVTHGWFGVVVETSPLGLVIELVARPAIETEETIPGDCTRPSICLHYKRRRLANSQMINVGSVWLIHSNQLERISSCIQRDIDKFTISPVGPRTGPLKIIHSLGQNTIDPKLTRAVKIVT